MERQHTTNNDSSAFMRPNPRAEAVPPQQGANAERERRGVAPELMANKRCVGSALAKRGCRMQGMGMAVASARGAVCTKTNTYIHKRTAARERWLLLRAATCCHGRHVGLRITSMFHERTTTQVL